MRVRFKMNFKFCFLLVAATVVASASVDEDDVVRKGRNLIIVEPGYEQYEYMNDDPQVMDEEIYTAGGSYGDDIEMAESNLVFRPLFAYRKQMAKRRRIYTEPSDAAVPTPAVAPIRSRRRYVVRYPVFRKNPNYPKDQYDYVP